MDGLFFEMNVLLTCPFSLGTNDYSILFFKIKLNNLWVS